MKFMMKFKKRRKELFHNISIIIFMTFVFCAMFELAARVVMAIYTKESGYLTYYRRFEPLKVHNLKMKSYQAGKNIYFKGIPNTTYKVEHTPSYIVTYNSKGYRTYEFKDKKSLIRIACFGGSSTWGAGNNNNETWPAYLQRYTDKLFANKYEVINAGFGGYNTTLILNLIKNEFIDYKPDIIVIYSGYNESTGGQPEVFSNTSKFQLLKHNIHNFISGKSVLYYASNRIFSKGNPLDAIKTSNRIIKKFKENIIEVLNICIANKIKLVIVKQPLYVKSLEKSSAEPGFLFFKYYKDPYFNEETFKIIQNDLKKKIFYAKYGRTYYYQFLILKAIDEIKTRYKEIIVIDSVNKFISKNEKGESLFFDVVHLTREGNNILAKEIFEHDEFQKILNE